VNRLRDVHDVRKRLDDESKQKTFEMKMAPQLIQIWKRSTWDRFV